MTSLALGQNVSIEDSNNDINDYDGFSTILFFGFERRQVLNDRISLFHINRKFKTARDLECYKNPCQIAEDDL